MSVKSLIVLCALVSLVNCKSIMVGEIANSRGLLNKYLEETYYAHGIPFFKRVFEEEYEIPSSYTKGKIKGIVIKDLGDGMAEPAITLGGVGFDFTSIKVTSERGSGLNILIEIYV